MNTIKQHALLFLLALASLSSLPGCSADDLPGSSPEGANSAPASSFQIHVTDGGYASADAKPGTRAEEKAYKTVFTAGDRIGVFAVKGNKVVDEVKNLCLTAQSSSNGIVWQTDDGKDIKLSADATYYAYYPYRPSLTGDLASGATDAAGFFANVISRWSIAIKQDTYANYTAQDLMIAKGTLNGKELSFSMQHQMALVVIDLPRTKYTFNNTPTIPEYIIDAPDLHFTGFSPCRMSDGTYRYLVKPGASKKLSGSYTKNAAKATWQFDATITLGNYKVFKVDQATVTKISHTLTVGDFYMKDGSLLAGSTTQLSNEQKTDVVGIVFWVGDATKKDKKLESDHPDCTHGLVVALNDVEGGTAVWQNPSSSVQSWLNSNRSSVYLSVASGYASSDPLNNIQGYNNTKAIEDFNAANGGNLVQAVVKVDDYRKRVHVPNNSSQWYLPSEKELTLLCGKDVNNIWSNNSDGTANKDLINGKLSSISSVATEILSTEYWSSTEASDNSGNAFYVFFVSGNVSNYSKGATSRVRCVLAF